MSDSTSPFFKHVSLVFLCHSWLAIRRNFVIAQNVPWSSEAWNSIWAKPVNLKFWIGLKLFNVCFFPLIFLYNLSIWSPGKRTWYHTHQSCWSEQSGSSTTIKPYQECEEFTLPPLAWSQPAWWVCFHRTDKLIIYCIILYYRLFYIEIQRYSSKENVSLSHPARQNKGVAFPIGCVKGVYDYYQGKVVAINLWINSFLFLY